MKSILLPILVVSIAISFSACVSTTSVRSSGPEQTVMLHWLSSDESGLVRNSGSDGNQTSGTKLFSGKAIETFEQSPTKSVSSWKNGKRHGVTIEFFYNGRKRRRLNTETVSEMANPWNIGLPGNFYGKKIMNPES